MELTQRALARDTTDGILGAGHALQDGLVLTATWLAELRDGDGDLIDVGVIKRNLIVDVGLTYLIGSALIGVTPVTTWYVGLLGSAPTIAAGNTMASHAGWAEVHTIYSEATRPVWTGVAGAAGIVTNTASKARFTFTGPGTVGGLFLASNNTKNGGTGTLFSGKAFSGGDLAVANTYTLDATLQLAVA
jgi:hypothetical protein